MIERDLQLSAFPELVASDPVGPVLGSVYPGQRNAGLIDRIAPLYLEGRVLDVTHGEGQWWEANRPPGLIATDLDPERALDAVADFTALPFPDRSVDAVAFDPPYMPNADSTSRFAERFGLNGIGNRGAMDALIAAGLAECKRVTDRWLLVKCNDYSNGSQFFLGHVTVANAAEALDLEPWDLIVHHSGPGPGHKVETQRRARRCHSYLMVYRRRQRS